MKHPKFLIIFLSFSNLVLALACLFLLLRSEQEASTAIKPLVDTAAVPEILWAKENALQPSEPPDILGDSDSGNAASLLKAVENSIAYLSGKRKGDTLLFGATPVSMDHGLRTLRAFRTRLERTGLSDSFFVYLRNNYQFFKSAADSVLFTGYYEACLKGSLKRSERFTYPVYRKPKDIVTVNLSRFYFYERVNGIPKYLRGRFIGSRRLVPYYSREDIDSKNILAGRGLELVWVDDPVALFFLQIQGSGIVELDNGRRMRLNYASGNGQEYKAIGKYLIDKGVFTYEEMSMQRIRQYIKEHPEEMEEVFNYNPSYVFFTKGGKGPQGALGRPITAMRSIATDLALFPKGALGFIETEVPEFDSTGSVVAWKPYRAFVCNHDTGGAIKGPGRVDLFTGFGPEAELIAGYMKQRGTLYFLIKKQDTAS